MGENTLEIGSLNKGVAYYFTIDAYNENGITRTFPDKSLPLINRLHFYLFSFPTNIRLLSFSWSVAANSFSWAFASGGHLPEARWASIIS